MNISDRTKVLFCAGPQAAAQTAVNGAVVDLQNYDNVRFLACLGDVDVNCVLTLKVQTGTASDGTDMADVPLTFNSDGTPRTYAAPATFTASATSADNKFLSLDVVQTRGKRYARCVLSRTGGNAVVNTILAELYDGHLVPTAMGDQVARVVTRGG